MVLNKSKKVQASIALINSKVRFMGEVEGNEPVFIDYIPPLGDNQGYTSLELFLLSLSSCVGTAILVLLRKMNKSIESFEVESKGIRKDQHPTGFKTISLSLRVTAINLSSEEMDKVIQMARPICPVLSMIEDQVSVEIKYSISN